MEVSDANQHRRHRSIFPPSALAAEGEFCVAPFGRNGAKGLALPSDALRRRSAALHPASDRSR
jgi:hypothetical protein